MDKNFMPIFTAQFNRIINEIANSLDVPMTDVHKHISSDSDGVFIRKHDTQFGNVGVYLFRYHDEHTQYCLNETEITVNVDREEWFKSVITSDHELDRILQIIKCLNPNRFPSPVGVISGITDADDEPFIVYDDFGEAHNFSGLEEVLVF